MSSDGIKNKNVENANWTCFGTVRLKKCFGTVRLKKWVWNHSQFLTSLKSQCLKWPTFGILFLLRLIYVSDNNMGQKRKQFQLATFSLHFIFCPCVAGKVVKTKEQMFPPGGWPCHTLNTIFRNIYLYRTFHFLF